MAPQRVFLVRHGETEWTRTGQHTGITDLPLTEAGRQQGRLLTDRLTDIDFALVLSSPRQRALETCRQAGLLDRAEVSEDLREWDYGAYEGLTRDGWNCRLSPAPTSSSARPRCRCSGMNVRRP